MTRSASLAKAPTRWAFPGWCAAALVGVLGLCASFGLAQAGAAEHGGGTWSSPLASLGVPGSIPASLHLSSSASGAAVALRVVDDPAIPVRPTGRDLAVNRPANSGQGSLGRWTAIALTGSARAPSGTSWGRLVSGASVGFGAPDFSRLGGMGPVTSVKSGGSGSGSAMIATALLLPVHSGFALSRIENRDAEMHAAIRPLAWPG